MRRAAYFIYLFFIVALALEIGLRIYNPFHLRLKGDKIILPVNQQVIITNRINPKLDATIINTRNSLGFRGPELPGRGGLREASGDRAAAQGDSGALLKIIAIGGSTTECHFLNDEKTWPYLLGGMLADSFRNCWLNNAGMDGHSTYGHLVLLNGHVKQLRPSVVLFLTGINDIENDAPTFHDKLNTRGAVPDWRHYVVENSEVLNLLVNLARGWRAQKFNNTTGTMEVLDSLRHLSLPDSVMNKRMAEQKPYLDAYRSRLLQLADTCLAWNILPVFITQPNQFGTGRDPVTHADLELYPVDPKDPKMNGRLIWNMLEQYNDVVRRLCAERKLPMIDLARRLPKDSDYFYDMSHFTNAGAAKVAVIVDSSLQPVLERYFPAFRR
jgi:lysophospholipase L1-like esterase